MKLRGLIYNFGLKLVYPVLYLGKWDTGFISYNVTNNAKFKLRVNTSDKLILLEVWKTKTYIDQDFDIKKNDVVVDVGANIGAFSVLAAKKAFDGKIYAYEPDKENCDMLKKIMPLMICIMFLCRM